MQCFFFLFLSDRKRVCLLIKRFILDRPRVNLMNDECRQMCFFLRLEVDVSHADNGMWKWAVFFLRFVFGLLNFSITKGFIFFLCAIRRK